MRSSPSTARRWIGKGLGEVRAALVAELPEELGGPS